MLIDVRHPLCRPLHQTTPPAADPAARPAGQPLASPAGTTPLRRPAPPAAPAGTRFPLRRLQRPGEAPRASPPEGVGAIPAARLSAPAIFCRQTARHLPASLGRPKPWTAPGLGAGRGCSLGTPPVRGGRAGSVRCLRRVTASPRREEGRRGLGVRLAAPGV